MATEKIMAPVYPGKLLRKEFLAPTGIAAYRMAKDIGVPEQRGISADTAVRLSRCFGMRRELINERAGSLRAGDG